MEVVINPEKVAVTLLLNPSDVQDVLAVIRALRFPIQIQTKKETPREMLYRFAAESPKMSDEDAYMDEITEEIKAYREEKRQALAQQLKVA